MPEVTYTPEVGVAVVAALEEAGVPLKPTFEAEPVNADIELDPAGWRDANPYRGWSTWGALWVAWRENTGWYLLPFLDDNSHSDSVGGLTPLHAEDPEDVAAAVVELVFPKGIAGR